MNNTPRTDQFIGEDSEWSPAKPKNWPAFSRQLERELNAANSKIELLMSANADVARIADERDAAEKRVRLLIAERDTARRQADQQYKLRDEFSDLLGTDDVEQGVAAVREMKERIKRLEEAGDAMLNAENDDAEYEAILQWNKAKEAKP